MVAIETVNGIGAELTDEQYFTSDINSQTRLRNKMIEKYIPLVRKIAGTVCSSTSANVEYDDLVSWGIFGLMSAIDNFDSSRNVNFISYSKLRIRGAMLDGLREMDWVPRHTRRKTNQFKRAINELSSELEREPDRHEVADRLGITSAEYNKTERMMRPTGLVSLESLLSTDDGESGRSDCIADNRASNPFDAVQLSDSRTFFMNSLGETERMIVTYYYYEQLTMRQIGENLNISESRVSQIHSAALKRLRKQTTQQQMASMLLAHSC